MRLIRTIALLSARDVLRSRWGIVFLLFFLAATEGMLQISGQVAKSLLNLINLSILLLPLISVIFGTIYFYNSREFVELLLTQPVRRGVVLSGMFAGLTASLVLCYWIGTTIPFALHGLLFGETALTLGMLLGVGALLILSFVGLAFLTAVYCDDRGKGIGIAMLSWLTLAVVFDGILLLIVYQFSEYPIERLLLALTLLNPIDLGRIALILRTDFAALMGHSGALFRDFFGAGWGMAVSITSLLLWSTLPFVLSLRRFQRRDF